MKERTRRRYPLARERISGSGVGRRCVRENVRAKKERLDPGRAEWRNLRELNAGLRRPDEGRMRRVIVVASRDQCNGASVIAAVRINVNARVQLRRNTQHERPEKRRGDKGRNKSAAAFLRTCTRAHCTTSLSPPGLSRKQFPGKDGTAAASLPATRPSFRSF